MGPGKEISRTIKKYKELKTKEETCQNDKKIKKPTEQLLRLDSNTDPIALNNSFFKYCQNIIFVLIIFSVLRISNSKIN